MFRADVYKIMIGAPSDINDEVNIVKEVLQEWNFVHAEMQGVILLPTHWTMTYPMVGLHPQKTINKQIVAKSDLLVCIFGTRIGTPTDTSESGTIEEINEHLEANKPVMIFFKNSTSDINNIDMEQLTKLKIFKQSIRDGALYCEFKDTAEFEKIFYQKLQLCANDNFIKNKVTSSERTVIPVTNLNRDKQLKSSVIENRLSEFDIEKLKAWTSANDSQFFQMTFLDGSHVYALGSQNQYTVNSGKEKAEWDDFFDKLLGLELISIEKYNPKGLPIYKLKKAAYNFFEKP